MRVGVPIPSLATTSIASSSGTSFQEPETSKTGPVSRSRGVRTIAGRCLANFSLRPLRIALNERRQVPDFEYPRLYDRIVASHAYGRVARDFARFNGAPADFLPPGDVGPPERVQSEALEIALRVLRGNLERLPDAGIPHRLGTVFLLRKDPVVRLRDSLLGDPLPVPVG